MMLANPAYGSFESAPYGHDFKLSDDEKTDQEARCAAALAG